jgi:hypothetical protein
LAQSDRMDFDKDNPRGGLPLSGVAEAGIRTC